MLLRALFLVLHAFLSSAEFFSHLPLAGCDRSIEVQISILLFIQLSVFLFFINYIKVFLAVSVKPYIVIVLGNCVPVTLTYISHPNDFYIPVTLMKSTQLSVFSAAVIAVIVNPYIVIVLGNCVPVTLTYISHCSIFYSSDINEIYTVKCFLCGSNSGDCQSLHSNCSWQLCSSDLDLHFTLQ